jgi:hypothetical protein
MHRLTHMVGPAALAGLLGLAGCGSYDNLPDRAGGGAPTRAAGGAAVGAIFGGVGAIPGALIGAAIGGGTGVATTEQQINLGEPVWKEAEERAKQKNQQSRQVEQEQQSQTGYMR